MVTWFTADHHFGHGSIIDYCRRPFKSVEEMDAELIRRWNEKVRPGDVVYHLGDFQLCHSHKFESYLEKLNGTIRLVPGSHDQGWIRHITRIGRPVVSKSKYPIEILPQLATVYPHINQEAREIVLCHYSMRRWEASHYGSWHLFGHSHGLVPPLGKSFDVGVDCWDFYPISLERVSEKMATLSMHEKV